MADILLVDDSDRVRKLIVHILTPHYEIAEASTASAARAWLSADPAVRLLITDLMLPDESGITLADYSRTHHPGVEVLLTSGHSLAGYTRYDFIAKPFQPGDLLEAVTCLLARSELK